MTLKFHSRTPSLLQGPTLRLRTRRVNCGIRVQLAPISAGASSGFLKNRGCNRGAGESDKLLLNDLNGLNVLNDLNNYLVSEE
jgi:hypothetical protein